MSENINVFGLQSFTDPSEAWKVMSSGFGSYEIDLQTLNDKTFVKAVMEQIIIRVVDYKTGRISREELEFSLGVHSEAMDSYMVNFNFFLYSQKNKKFYTSIIETENACCSGALSEDEKALFKAQGGLSVAGGCRCLTKDGNTSIEKEGYIPYPLQA